MPYKNPNYQKEYRIKNKERIREQSKERVRAYNIKNKERKKEYMKEWWKNHRGYHKEYKKKYNEEHKEELKIKAKKHREENIEEYKLRDKNRIYTVQRKNNIFANKIKTMYGIDISEYNNILAKQNGRCAICGKSKDEFKRNLAVDHDHKTNKVRGLLCDNCNPLLGHAKDNIDILQRAIEYLKNNV